ncbi:MULTISPECIES: RagB/SusD family nutrient uptake outer membrane protein [unclassified Spirosoma]|uniref:RagB/SusD family nutrient uptake outer membrane protein n=1 Tax=unclassified Spirosoma TaxID=2621999 RepID=UPI00096236FD|nr:MULTISPECIES: RagB/SusD family nutrient uptake outer membrane protein [unclassified Spirosoma]MBN8821378.1 RagB/SusD family nutrient uptake outer membrane protein [Spirosoma sp.]OJW78165.1 MAG: RagB/SusD family nutrient uptake outer membrane protein [Spirosoma sp. 48-14]
MKLKFLTIAIAVGLLTTACDKEYLETAPTGSIDAGAAYATTKNAAAAINGIYRAMIVRYLDSQGHFGHPAMMIILDVLGEDVVIPNTSNTWHLGETRWQAHRSETSVGDQLPYQLYYRLIGNANIAIANIDAAAGAQTERNQIKGEALGLRAFSYFNLVQLFGKRYNAASKPNSQLAVPLVLSPTTEGLPRATVEDVYAQINKDLAEAATLLTTTRTYKSHINLDVIKGLQARVALAQQNWTDAAKYAAEARKSYVPMTATQYQDGFSDISNPEWMWGFDHLEDQTEYFGAYHSYISCNFNSTNIRVDPKVINSKLYDQIPTTDVRSKMWVKAPTTANSIVPTGGVRVPYITQKFKLPGTPSTSTMGDVPYMRAAEMYLIEAEAQARLGNTAAAASTLFTLISQRDPSYKLSTKTGNDLIDEILFHRRVELWGEGFRFTDLKRLNQPLNRNGANLSSAVSVIFDVPAGDNQWEFLIPRREINANAKIVQNPL